MVEDPGVQAIIDSRKRLAVWARIAMRLMPMRLYDQVIIEGELVAKMDRDGSNKVE